MGNNFNDAYDTFKKKLPNSKDRMAAIEFAWLGYKEAKIGCFPIGIGLTMMVIGSESKNPAFILLGLVAIIAPIVWAVYYNNNCRRLQKIGYTYIDSIYNNLYNDFQPIIYNSFRKLISINQIHWESILLIPQEYFAKYGNNLFQKPRNVNVIGFFITQNSLIIIPSSAANLRNLKGRDKKEYINNFSSIKNITLFIINEIIAEWTKDVISVDFYQTIQRYITNSNDNPIILFHNFDKISIIELYFSEVVNIEYSGNMKGEIGILEITTRDGRILSLFSDSKITEKIRNIIRDTKPSVSASFYGLNQNYPDQTSSVEGDWKTCPMCAEQVKSAAKICRFCRHEFEA